MSATFTVTGRLVGLRALRADDLDQLAAWGADPQTVARPDVGLSVVELASGDLIGHVTLQGAAVKDRCATLAAMIGAPYQGRGLGTDAVRTLIDYGFTELGLHRIELSVDGDDPASIAACRAAGFVEEGRRREAIFRAGRWHDRVQMGILARERQATPAGSEDATLRIEVFAQDLDAFVDFYTRVLGFAIASDQRQNSRPYAAVVLGSVRIGAARPWTEVDPGARDVPTGTEIVLEVNDVEEAYRRATESGWPIAGALAEQPWGLQDFRLHDPDGYYVRVTGR